MNLFLLTSSFPYGNMEKTFLQSEIITLSKTFNKVFIIPSSTKGSRLDIPANCHVLNLDEINLPSNKTYFLESIFKVILFVLNGNIKLRNIKEERAYLQQRLIDAHKYKILISNKLKENNIFYSYWWEQWATVHSLISKKLPNHYFISRAHRFDLYEELYKDGIRYRKLHLQNTDEVVCIAEQAESYLNQKYPNLKVSLHKLGINDNFKSLSIAKLSKTHIVSCSSLTPQKRLDRLINSLKHVKSDIKWVHFGDGKLADEIKSLAKNLPNNIEYQFMGFTKNEDIVNYYNENYIDLFINSSDSEGIPVSIMEAISFGIPVVAGNVGGNAEIVNNENGFLLDLTTFEKELAEIIDEKLYLKKDRSEIRKFWKQNYTLKNFDDFANYLGSLYKK
jgi:glycosyltransferase involved in cell wall biosynthesis